MSNVWDRFESIVKAEEVVEARSSFEPLDEGEYEVKLESIEAGESKSGLPMMKVKLRTKENRVIFFNQMLQNINYPRMNALNVATANAFVNGLRGEDITFTTLTELADRIATTELDKEYIVKLSYGNKDTERSFPKITILENLEEIPFA